MSRRAASRDTMDVRQAVAACLEDLAPGACVVVACSGGPDSLALAAATAWVASRSALNALAVVIDHGLQEDSARVADSAARTCAALGLPASVRTVSVGDRGGPEAAARDARYAALAAYAQEVGAAAVLLGHTREDQAETVLLRLARGSGARSLAAMAPRSGVWRRPLLDLPRATVRAAAAQAVGELGGGIWSDPHNEDRDFARVRVRALLDDLVTDLGPGVVLGLSRSAELLREDADALDALAESAFAAQVRDDAGSLSASCDDLGALPAAVRTRVIRRMALACGCPGEDLGIDQIRALDRYVTAWHGQGPTHLPGRVLAERTCGRLCLLPSLTSMDSETGAVSEP